MSEHVDDAELRAAYTPRLQEPAGPRGPDCPSPDALHAALHGQGPEGERLQVLDHALSCAWCRRELALLHAVSGADTANGALARARRFGWQRIIPLAAAASIALVLGIISIDRWREPTRDETVRGADAGGPALIEPRAGSTHRPGAVRFAWRAVPDAFRYALEVNDADGSVLFATATSDTTTVAALTALPRGDVHWFVRAQMDDGSERRSETRLFRLQ